MAPAEVLVLVHLAATLFMVGVIWFVQVVHYPLFARVGGDGWVGYAGQHTRRTGWVVAPPMLVEAAAAGGLVIVRPVAIPSAWAWLGLLLLGLVWLSTARVQVPRHRRLGEGFDAGVARSLVSSNWVRTAGWSARGALALAMVARLLG